MSKTNRSADSIGDVPDIDFAGNPGYLVARIWDNCLFYLYQKIVVEKFILSFHFITFVVHNKEDKQFHIVIIFHQ